MYRNRNSGEISQEIRNQEKSVKKSEIIDKISLIYKSRTQFQPVSDPLGSGNARVLTIQVTGP